MNDTVRAKLKTLLASRGHALARDPRALRNLLRDECGEHKGAVNALVAAAEAGVPRALEGGGPYAMLEERLTAKLQADHLLTPEAALWTVRAWAEALGNALTDGRIVPEPPATETSARPAPRRPWAVPVLVASAVLLVGAVVALLVVQDLGRKNANAKAPRIEERDEPPTPEKTVEKSAEKQGEPPPPVVEKKAVKPPPVQEKAAPSGPVMKLLHEYDMGERRAERVALSSFGSNLAVSDGDEVVTYSVLATRLTLGTKYPRPKVTSLAYSSNKDAPAFWTRTLATAVASHAPHIYEGRSTGAILFAKLRETVQPAPKTDGEQQAPGQRLPAKAYFAENAHKKPVIALCATADRRLMSFDQDGRLLLREIDEADGKPKKVEEVALSRPAQFASIAARPGGAWLVVAGDGEKLWFVVGRNAERLHQGDLDGDKSGSHLAVGLSGNGSRLVTGHQGCFRVWRLDRLPGWAK